MADRNNLRVAALFTLLLITEAMYTSPIGATKRLLKSLVHKLHQDMRKQSICEHKSPASDHTFRCLGDLKSSISDCKRVSIFSTYFNEATDLDINPKVTGQLQEIEQYLQSLQIEFCKTPTAEKNCDGAFEKSDGEYEKFCKVMSLLELLMKWASS